MLGPFKVLAKIGKQAYRLDLPASYGKVHLVFYVSLLEEYRRRPGTEPPPPVEIDGEEELVVEKILDRRVTKGAIYY